MIKSRCRNGSLLIAIGIALTAAGADRLRADTAAKPASSETPAVRVLMFVGGVAHDYEALPLQLADNLKRQYGLEVRVTADLGQVSEEVLSEYDVIMFNTCLETGLNEKQREVLVDALRQGRGLVAMHCALWCFQDWPEWRKMLGGLVLKHDKFGPYDVVVVDRGHPIAAGVPEKFAITDEAYYVDERGRDIRVIAQTARVHPNRKTPDPQVWTTRYAGARVFVISQGHDQQAQTNSAFLILLAGGIRWAAGRLGPPAMLSQLERKDGFVPLFDGRTLNGWRYDPTYWKVQDGIIVGSSHPRGLEKNSFAISDKSFGDFVLRFSVKSVSGNSGVQFRSRALPDFEVAGYQADVVPRGWGNLHEQNGRRRLVDGWTGKAEKAVNPKDWNEMEVEARGSHIILRTNGVVTADWNETDPSGAKSGIIALQLHRGEPMEVRFTNIRIKPLD